MQLINSDARKKQVPILGMNTFAFAVCFAVWTI